MSLSFEAARIGRIANSRRAGSFVPVKNYDPKTASHRFEAVHAGESSRNSLRRESITSQARMARLATVHS